MNNHPNRNWRRVMHDAAAQWLSGPASVYWQMPVTPGRLPEAIRNRMEEAYNAGYIAGRASKTPRPKS